MVYRVVWVHGIGPTQSGYSKPWTQAYNPYLNFPPIDFIEVLWADVYTNIVSAMSADRLVTSKTAIPPTSQEQLTEDQIRKKLTAELRAHAAAQEQSPALQSERSQIINQAGTGQELLPPWVLNPDAYVGEFVKYLVNQNIRDAVKEKVKEKLRPLANSGDNCSIIAHSWGTVVAYESLLDLEKEIPAFKLAHLFTLGSSLWLVQDLLEDQSGRKPGNVANWVNIHAQGDVISNELKPAFQVDADYAVASFGNSDPHSSYFVPGNVAVENNIVATTILV